MNDEFDPFDIENVRSPEAAAAEAALRADREARKRNGGMPPELETKLAAHKAKGEGKKAPKTAIRDKGVQEGPGRTVVASNRRREPITHVEVPIRAKG